MKAEFRHEIHDVLLNERLVSSYTFTAAHVATQALEPADVGLRLFQRNGMPLLQYFMDCVERLERLHLISKDGLDA